MKKSFAVAVVMLFTFGFGCSVNMAYKAAQVAVAYSVPLIGTIMESALTPKEIVVDKEIEKYQIGNHDVGIYEGTYYDTPSFLLITKYVDEKKEKTRTIIFKKNSYKQMKLLADFNQLTTETEKKQRIRDWFINIHDLDLGPEPADKPPAPSASKPVPETPPDQTPPTPTPH